MKFHKFLAGTSMSLIYCAGSAHAAVPAENGLAAVAQAQTPNASGTKGEQHMSTPDQDDVIVTATRRQTGLQTTPIAITAITQGELDRKQVVNVTDLQRFVPSLQFTLNGVSNGVLLTLRGIGNDSAFALTGDPEVALYVDGIYSPHAQGASTLAYDLERVEVLRGPQGTLFGRNATIGAVQLITARASTDALTGYAEVLGGAYNRFGTRGAINVPVTDKLAVRVAFATESRDGYIKYQTPPVIAGVDPAFFTTSGERYYGQDQKSGRVSLAWKPNSSFRWYVNAEGTLDRGSVPIALMQTPRPNQKFWSALIDTPPNDKRYSVGLRSTMEYDISDYLQASYIAGYNRDGGTTQADFDVGVLPILNANGGLTAYASEINRTIFLRAQSLSNEIQLRSRGTNSIDWIIGGFYSHEKNAVRNDIDDREGYRGGPSSFSVSFLNPDRQVNSYAAFGQATWNITDRLHLTGGLRYTVDKKINNGSSTVTLLGCPAVTPPSEPPCRGIEGQYPGTTGPQLAALLGPQFFATSTVNQAKFNKLTYLARAEYKVNDDIFTYASLSTGFKSGIIDDAGVLTGPETLTNYEIGSKMKLFDRKLTLNVAAYYGDFKGFQIGSVLVTYDNAGNIISSKIQTLNADGADIYGLEVEANASPTPFDHIQFSSSLQKTRLRSLLAVDQRVDPGPRAPGAIQQLAGNELPRAPRFSASLTYEHDFPIGAGKISPRATIHYETSSYLSIFNGDRENRVVNGQPASYGDAFDKQKAYTRSDIALRYSAPGDRFSLEAFVQNVENRKVRVGAKTYGTVASAAEFLSLYAPPRIFGVRARTSF